MLADEIDNGHFILFIRGVGIIHVLDEDDIEFGPCGGVWP